VSATAIDLAGHQFGRLFVVKRSGTSKFGGAIWDCLCDCGGIVHAVELTARAAVCEGGRSDNN
jgi:hypothetical protein